MTNQQLQSILDEKLSYEKLPPRKLFIHPTPPALVLTISLAFPKSNPSSISSLSAGANLKAPPPSAVTNMVASAIPLSRTRFLRPSPTGSLPNIKSVPMDSSSVIFRRTVAASAPKPKACPSNSNPTWTATSSLIPINKSFKSPPSSSIPFTVNSASLSTSPATSRLTSATATTPVPAPNQIKATPRLSPPPEKSFP